MRERPILFSAPMVRATLDGSKTQTRRVVKLTDSGRVKEPGSPRNWHLDDPDAVLACPYGQPGDRMWIRETWAYHVQAIGAVCDEDGPFVYAADTFGKQYRLCEKWTPSIHMPRWASRILLEISAVRVERLQDISEEDAIAEGCINSLHLQGGRFAKENFEHLWWTINGDGSWEANPWVWVVEFKRVQP